jgi:hypothetical protein
MSNAEVQDRADQIVGRWLRDQARRAYPERVAFEVADMCQRCDNPTFRNTSNGEHTCPVCEYASPCEPAFALRFPVPSQE